MLATSLSLPPMKPDPYQRTMCLADYVWSCITSARLQFGGRDENVQPSCHCPCDIGKRINPKLPNAFFGNATPRLATSMNFKRPSHVAKKLQESDDPSPLDQDYPFRSQSSFRDRQRRRQASSPACSECRLPACATRVHNSELNTSSTRPIRKMSS